MPNNKSFTLIELLVVIAIIGLLASVVLVSMGGIKSKASITKNLEFSQSIQRGLGAYAVGIWSFDDQANPTKDASGYSNNGTINGATYISDTPHAAIDRGEGKWALGFDGSNDYVATPSQTITPPLTIEAWINYGIQSEPNMIVSDASSLSSTGFRFYVNGWGTENRQLRYDRNESGTINSPSGTITPNTWHHVVVTHNSDGAAFLYVDGKRVGQDSVPVFTQTAAIYIGSLTSGVNLFKGSIDEVRVYEKALTLGQIQKLYAAGLGRHQNLAIK